MLYNIYLINLKYELLLCYNECDHTWRIPTYDGDIKDIKDHFWNLFKIKYFVKHRNNNNIICHLTSSNELNNDMKWCKYHDIVELSVYEINKEIIDDIYKDCKLTVILDIDLTLLESCNTDNINTHPDHIINIYNKEYKIWLRPHLKYFLESIYKFTNIVYWTAAEINYQKPILNLTGLDKYSQNIYYRDSCSYDGTYFYKDLASKGFNMDKTILIDDNYLHKMQNPYNCVIIKQWQPTINDYLVNKDNELIKIIELLHYLTDRVVHDFHTIEECFILVNNNFSCSNYLNAVIG
jgi:hypothetical protein